MVIRSAFFNGIPQQQFSSGFSVKRKTQNALKCSIFPGKTM